MKKTVLVLVICVLGMLSCTNSNKLQTIFPLGISCQEVMNDEQFLSKSAYVDYATESDLVRILEREWKNETIKEGDFCSNIEVFKDVVGLYIEDYVKNGVLYDDIILLFKNDKLIQVLAGIDNRDGVVRFNIEFDDIIKKYGNPDYTLSEHTYYNNDTSSYYKMLYTLIKGNTHFDILGKWTDIFYIEEGLIDTNVPDFFEDEIYYSYYTTKLLPTRFLD